jgi:hypothetical protein
MADVFGMKYQGFFFKAAELVVLDSEIKIP